MRKQRTPEGSGAISVTLLAHPVVPGGLSAECPWCGLLVTLHEATDCQHYAGRDEGFTDVRLKFESVEASCK